MGPPALTLSEIVARLGGEAVGDSAAPLTGVATLDSAGPGEITFLSNPKYRAKLAGTRAGAVIVGPGDRDAATIPCIITDNPYAYYARTVALFHPAAPVRPGIHPFAQVDAAANVDAYAEIGPFVVIGAGASVARGAKIGAHGVIGERVSIGEGTRLNPRVTIYDDCAIGARCVLHAGVVIGADGFGMARDAGRWVKIPQVGKVRIGDDVEVGANTTIDRGALDDTVIEDGVKLDNHIHIAHNCRIGAHTAIAACVGIAGSTVIGKNCMIGGAAGIGGHLVIVDNVVVLGRAMVTKSIAAAGVYGSGLPAQPAREWRKLVARIRRLPGLELRLQDIEKKLRLTPPSGEGEGEQDDF